MTMNRAIRAGFALAGLGWLAGCDANPDGPTFPEVPEGAKVVPASTAPIAVPDDPPAKKGPRKSLAAPPKRVPLVQTGRQGPSFSHDMYGQGGGKENVPPGMEVFEGKNGATHIELNFSKLEGKKPASKPAKVHFSSKGSEVSSRATVKKEGTQKRTRTSTRHDESPAKALKTRADALASSSRTAPPKLNLKNVKSRSTRSPVGCNSPVSSDSSPTNNPTSRQHAISLSNKRA